MGSISPEITWGAYHLSKKKKKKKTVVPVGKQMERLTPAKNFPEKKDNLRNFSSFSTFIETTRNFCTICLHHYNQAPIRGFGHWPPHLFVTRLLRHSQIDPQLERIIPSLISSVGNVQCHLSKTSHRKFRLNGKRPCFSTFSGRNRGSFSEQRLVIEGSSCAAVFSLPAPTVVPLFFHAAES